MLYILESDADSIAANVDEYGDSFCRHLTIRSLQDVCDTMPKPKHSAIPSNVLERLEEHQVDLEGLPASVFRRTVIYFDEVDEKDLDNFFTKSCVRFGNGSLADDIDDPSITHVVVGSDSSRLKEVRIQISRRSRIPRLVSVNWVTECWKEKTLLDEDRMLSFISLLRAFANMLFTRLHSILKKLTRQSMTYD
jgi:DNA ligase-4